MKNFFISLEIMKLRFSKKCLHNSWNTRKNQNNKKNHTQYSHFHHLMFSFIDLNQCKCYHSRRCHIFVKPQPIGKPHTNSNILFFVLFFILPLQAYTIHSFPPQFYSKIDNPLLLLSTCQILFSISCHAI